MGYASYASLLISQTMIKKHKISGATNVFWRTPKLTLYIKPSSRWQVCVQRFSPVSCT